MNAICLGIDLVEVTRIADLRKRHPTRFVERCFTAGEREYCLGRRREAEHLAVRFAAKEAVLKALGTGLVGGLHWTDIEVHRNADGKPTICLHNLAAEHAARLGVKHWLVSLSHTDSMGMASVIGVGTAPEET
jgi:holo-[acyl-carrier protein] synthase